MFAVRALSSPSGVAKEDNVEERENYEVKQFFGWAELRSVMFRDFTDGQTDVEVEIVF